jgi:putative endonuclease
LADSKNLRNTKERWPSGHFCESENVFEHRAKSEMREIFLVNKEIYNEPWYVYIAECRDRTLYVGVAKDVYRRIKEHNSTNKCRYTRFRKPLKLVHKEICQNYTLARKRESEVKKFSRKKKLALITLEDLNKT